ncbi:MAG: hypothetical protein D6696_08930 [Acidobacteria bacterium]|nr:MAG: hypothetical protein D6696_08930 [Acidobacteriota bacterium]
MKRSAYEESVFINCPFDAAYLNLLNAILFAVFDCGYKPRCAQEADDGSQVRIQKIYQLIAGSKLGIHDISRTGLDPATNLPRFNMPFELGVFLGAKRFGDKHQRSKNCLILDKEPYRYQQYISDISGQDIRAHGDDPETVISIIRDWLKNASPDTVIPGGKEIFRRYKLFMSELPELCAEIPIDPSELTYNDYTSFISEWLRVNA